MFPFNITNPGIFIEGLLTSQEANLVTNLAGLTPNDGDTFIYDTGTGLWTVGPGGGGGGSGDVVGPASATDNAIPRFDTTTGKLIQGSDLILEDDETMKFPVSSGGIQIFNTSDQVTNWERGVFRWASNILEIGAQRGGTGLDREVRLIGNGGVFSINSSGTFDMNRSTGSSGVNIVSVGGTHTNSSGITQGIRIVPTINQSGTAGYTGLLINPTETTTGSGVKRLISTQVGSLDRFVLLNTGEATFYSQAATQEFSIGRNANERIRFYVDDGDGLLEYRQDETGTEAHNFNFNINSASTGNQSFAFKNNNTTIVNITKTGETTFSGDVIVPDEAYGAGWNGSLEVPTKNALYDKIETLGAGGGNYFNSFYIDQSAGTSDTYGVLGGAVNGSNVTFTVSQGIYRTGTLKVFLNGQLQTQGTSEDWDETTPASGTFNFNIAPQTGDLITVEYQTQALTGSTVLTTSSVLNDLADVIITAPANTEVLKYNGTNWVNAPDAGSTTTIVGITGTKAQFDTAVTDGNFLYVGDVTSNATHTGDVTGSTTLTIDKTAITGKTAVTAVGTDYVLISDTDDTGNLKKALVSDFLGASGSQSVNVEAAGSATLVVGELSTGSGSILNIVESNASGQTITLPAAITGDIGKFYQIYNKGTNKMTITSASTLNGDSVILAASAGCVAFVEANGFYRLVGTGNQSQEIQIPCFDWTTNVSTGDGKYYLRIPAKYNGWEITGVHAEVITAGTTGTTDIQIANVTDAVDILSTKLTIDSTETGSDTAATPAVINTSNNTLATEDRIRIDVDAVSTTPPQGLIVSITIQPK